MSDELSKLKQILVGYDKDCFCDTCMLTRRILLNIHSLYDDPIDPEHKTFRLQWRKIET